MRLRLLECICTVVVTISKVHVVQNSRQLTNLYDSGQAGSVLQSGVPEFRYLRFEHIKRLLSTVFSLGVEGGDGRG